MIAMLSRLLSDDLPRSRCWRSCCVVILLGLAFAPFLFPGTKALNVAAKICVFILLVASYDLLLGYTGIVSFAHTMFFGIGAYGVAIASHAAGPGWAACGRHRARRSLSLVLSLADRPVLPAGAGDLLRHDHAGGGVGLRDAGVAAVGLHRRRGRHDLRLPGLLRPASGCSRSRCSA